MNEAIRWRQMKNIDYENSVATLNTESFQLTELIDTAELNFLFNNFCNSVGIAAAIIDLQGEVLIASRWQRICTNFHRVNQNTYARCIEDDADLALRLNAGKNFSVYQCKNGMTNAASPIIIEDRHLANAFVGQFLLSPPDRNYFELQAENAGFDSLAYFNALEEVPIISKENLAAILELLSGFAKLIASIGLQRLRVERISDELSQHKKALECLIEQRTLELHVANMQLRKEIAEHKQIAEAQNQALSRLHKIASLVPGVVLQLRLSPNGSFCIPYASDAIRSIYRVNPEEVAEDASKVFAVVHPDDLDGHLFAIQASAKYLLPWVNEYRLKFEDGKVCWLFGNALPQREADGSTLWHGLITGITERKITESELRVAATAFEAQEGMMITDASYVILRVNHAFTEITGYTAEEAIGQTPRLLSSGRHDAAFYAAMWELIGQTGVWKGDLWNRRKNGEEYPVQLSITAVKSENEEVTHYISTLHDITERKLAEEEIKNLAFYDTLTQLPNRRMLNDRIGQALAASKRGGHYGALMFLDLDNFKPLNDQYGHGMGDMLLVEVAHRLIACVREMDTVARFGGDEFVVMLGELLVGKAASVTQAGMVAEKIHIALAEPYLLTFKHEGEAEATIRHLCAASIGVVVFNSEDNAEDIIKWADIAMYHAKDAGRNQTQFYVAQA